MRMRPRRPGTTSPWRSDWWGTATPRRSRPSCPAGSRRSSRKPAPTRGYGRGRSGTWRRSGPEGKPPGRERPDRRGGCSGADRGRYSPRMLVNTRLAETPDVVVDDVRCNGGPAWSGPEECARPLVIFVRSGCFRRRADGEETFLDPTTMYFQRSGQEQQVGHPRDGGDACTAFELSDELLAFLAGGEPALPTEPVHVDGRVAVAHRRLAAACVAGTDRFEITERASSIVATVLARSGSPAVHAGRPGTVRARRKL